MSVCFCLRELLHCVNSHVAHFFYSGFTIIQIPVMKNANILSQI